MMTMRSWLLRWLRIADCGLGIADYGECQGQPGPVSAAPMNRGCHSFKSAIPNPQSAILGLSLLLLSGCAIGPNYHRPEADIPQQFKYSLDPGQTNSLADLPWWQLFNDPTLTNLIQLALTNNYDIRIATARVEQSRALAEQARSQLFPQAGYDVNSYRGKNASQGAPNPAGNGATAGSTAAVLNAAWEIDLWGRLRRLNEAARAQFFASEEARRGVRLSLIAEVAQDYFQLLELDKEVEIARQTTNSYGESLTLFQQRLGGGVASKLEADRPKARWPMSPPSSPIWNSASASWKTNSRSCSARVPAPSRAARP
jgi:multidrug efflux system outer membrane protein